MIQLRDSYSQGPSGLFTLDIFRKGKLIERFEENNLIVDNSKQIHARLLGGSVAGQSVTQFGVGTNGTAPVGGNSSLTGQYLKPIDLVTYPQANQTQFAFSLGTTEANGLAIMEFGLFTAAGALYARKVRSAALNKASDLTLAGTWLITF